jgi:hypothetical protein
MLIEVADGREKDLRIGDVEGHRHGPHRFGEHHKPPGMRFGELAGPWLLGIV